MKNIIIAPSILSIGNDLKTIVEKMEEIKNDGVKWVHVDIMDGKFVEAKTYDYELFRKFSSKTILFKDVHIMVYNPLEVADKYCKAGANNLTFHLEACKNDEEVNKLINIIKENNVKVGMSISPDTPVENIFPYVKDLDLILIMSVHPGRGGQEFITESLEKINKLRKYIDKNGFKTLIEVDGGINDKTADECEKAGANVLVVGTYIFNSTVKERIDKLLK